MEKTLDQMQAEVKTWAEKNFGAKTPSHQPLLGVMEEAGELAHAHLKGEQGIREGTNRAAIMAMKIDAVGDITVFLMHYCCREGINFQTAVQGTWDKVKKRDWTATRAGPFTGGAP